MAQRTSMDERHQLEAANAISAIPSTKFHSSRIACQEIARVTLIQSTLAEEGTWLSSVQAEGTARTYC
uniref:Uncharacterized protein n=1 Tax=Ditylenchus dipsaci TaxID=166011 RepID=A0A915CSE0_9BILA